MKSWDDLERPLDESPLFHVEQADGVQKAPEIANQRAFLNAGRYLAPQVLIFANANAGKRNPMVAKREGIMAGVFDLTAAQTGRVAWVEFKGHTKAGRAGALSQSQVDWGNAMSRMGFDVGCFFDPLSAWRWLKELGFNVGDVK